MFNVFFETLEGSLAPDAILQSQWMDFKQLKDSA